MPKRKRGPGVGHYVDEETGAVRTVETSKHVKLQHKKSGVYYKQPTEHELRRWDREEDLLNRAQRIAKLEENKKKNAAKRVQKNLKDREFIERQYAEGKITFTQTLAKKDEDQVNLHKWFGGRPRSPRKRVESFSCENGEDTSGGNYEKQPCQSSTIMKSTEVDGLNEQDLAEFFNGSDELEQERLTGYASANVPNEHLPTQNTSPAYVALVRSVSQQAPSTFRSSVAANTSRKRDTYTFKIPQLPPHIEHKPTPPTMSAPMEEPFKSVNKELDSVSRQTQRTTSDHLDVQNLLEGICTQDLCDFEDSDKENEMLRIEASFIDAADHQTSRKRPGTESRMTSHNRSPLKQTDRECDGRQIAPVNCHARRSEDNVVPQLSSLDDEFEDDGIDDQTLLLALSSPSLGSPVHLETASHHEEIEQITTERVTKFVTTRGVGDDCFDLSLSDSDLLQIAADLPTQSHCGQNDSFAMDGIDDDVLLEGLAGFEQENLGLANPASIMRRKKRILPWDLPTEEDITRPASVEDLVSQHS